MKIFAIISLLFLLASCWPQSISFKDKGSGTPDWKTFSLKTLENRAPNTPLSYAATLSESIKDGIQNNTKLLISSNSDTTGVDVEGVINLYSITPVAIQNGDAAAKNRLTISVS
ncbi:MAG: hypothetical protein MK066_07175, partial [Crocinitomicaceae bacterium]|nr:hypothetical protein [Crocinitomicaceae bacterium]